MDKQFKDARYVAYGRFRDKWFSRWCVWIGCGLAFIAAAIAVTTIIVSATNRPKIAPYPIYTIQSAYIEPDKDVVIMYDNGWYVVNSHILIKTPEAEMISKTYIDKLQDYWAIPMLILAIIVFCSAWIVVGIEEYRERIFYDKFMQKWAETKEYPDM
jgi:amino acid transporter